MNASTEQLSESDREELSLLYDVSVKDIAFFKKQQWVATNYGAALYVAILAIAQILETPLSTAHKVTLFLFSLGIMVAGVGVICHLQHSIAVRRARLKAVRASFGNRFQTAWGAVPKKDNALHSLLLAVLVFGFVVNTWLLALEL